MAKADDALVPLTEENVKGYLDHAIKQWRTKRDTAPSIDDRLKAMCYVDAYQSVRVSLFGELLPK